MKKQYIIPEIKVVKIQPNVLSVTSPGQPQDGNAVGPGMSRGFFDFGDDEDEE